MERKYGSFLEGNERQKKEWTKHNKEKQNEQTDKLMKERYVLENKM